MDFSFLLTFPCILSKFVTQIRVLRSAVRSGRPVRRLEIDFALKFDFNLFMLSNGWASIKGVLAFTYCKLTAYLEPIYGGQDARHGPEIRIFTLVSL